MATVSRLEDHRPHLSGPAQCMECRHQWEAVAPIGTYELKCPECWTTKGAWLHPILRDTPYWKCVCGNDYFRMYSDGDFCCARCGLAQSFEEKT